MNNIHIKNIIADHQLVEKDFLSKVDGFLSDLFDYVRVKLLFESYLNGNKATFQIDIFEDQMFKNLHPYKTKCLSVDFSFYFSISKDFPGHIENIREIEQNFYFKEYNKNELIKNFLIHAYLIEKNKFKSVHDMIDNLSFIFKTQNNMIEFLLLDDKGKEHSLLIQIDIFENICKKINYMIEDKKRKHEELLSKIIHYENEHSSFSLLSFINKNMLDRYIENSFFQNQSLSAPIKI